MSILLDEKFKAKTASAAAATASTTGRSVSHVTMACERCRRLKIRCSGSSPCLQCIKRSVEATCTIIESRKPRGKPSIFGIKRESGASIKARKEAMIKRESFSSSSGSSSSNSGNNNEFQCEAITSMSTSSSYRRNEQQLVVVAEKLLADKSVAKFLMDVFVRRIHPHLNTVASSPCFSIDKIFDRTMKPTDAIQRDAGLAMACRMCGHETLGNLLMKRMEMNYDRVKGEPLSYEIYAATAVLAASISTVHLARGLELTQSSFAMHRMLFPRKDPIAAACEHLENLSINDPDNPTEQVSGFELGNMLGCNEENGMYNDWASVTKEEITAHVQMAVSQLNQWAQTLQDPELRFFISLTTEMYTHIVVPSMRPCMVVFVALVMDLHLLGCMTPPYLMEVIRRHDPESSFGMVGIFKPCAAFEDSLEPCHLSEEITASLLRRAFVCRMLYLESKADMDVIASTVTTVEIMEIIIHWRSGNLESAAKIGRWLLQFLERQDLNFWNPMIPPSLWLLGSIFFEMRDGLGLMRLIAITDKLRRSQPTVTIGISVLKELQSKISQESVLH